MGQSARNFDIVTELPNVAEVPSVILIDSVAQPRPREPWLGPILKRVARFVLRWSRRLILAAFILAYPTAILLSHKIDDRVIVPGEDRVWSNKQLQVAAALLDREVSQHGWAPASPVWHPRARLDAMPAYQQGIADALGDYAVLLASLTATTAEPDADLSAAARLLKDRSDTRAEGRLLAAREAIRRYDGRHARGLTALTDEKTLLAEELALFAAWADSILVDLAPYRNDPNGVAFGGPVTKSFYRAKGYAYTAASLMAAVQQDHRATLREAGLEADYQRALDEWTRAAQLRPLIVMNGRPDGVLIGNHLMTFSFLASSAGKGSAVLSEKLSYRRADAASGALPEPPDPALP